MFKVFYYKEIFFSRLIHIKDNSECGPACKFMFLFSIIKLFIHTYRLKLSCKECHVFEKFFKVFYSNKIYSVLNIKQILLCNFVCKFRYNSCVVWIFKSFIFWTWISYLLFLSIKCFTHNFPIEKTHLQR